MKTIQSQQTEIDNSIKDINAEIDLLQEKKNKQLDAYRETQKQRSIGLVDFYNHMVNYQNDLTKSENVVSWCSDSELINSIKIALHRRSQNHKRYRSKLERLYNYISYSYSYDVDMKKLKSVVNRCKTYNARIIIEYLDLQTKLELRKREHQVRLLPKVDNYIRRLNMSDFDRGCLFYRDVFQSYTDKTKFYFINKLAKNNGTMHYNIDFRPSYDEYTTLYQDFINKKFTIEEYKKHIFVKLSNCYKKCIASDKGHDSSRSDIIEKARKHRKLNTMTRKDRVKLNVTKWLKIKNMVELFKVPAFDTKIDFSAVNNAKHMINVKENAKKVLNSIYGNTTVETFINECGVVEYRTMAKDVLGNSQVVDIAIWA